MYSRGVTTLRSLSRLDPDEDRRLAELCLAGDAASWDALVRRHERLVYAVARSYRLSEPDIGDVFQEVFAALVRGLPNMRDTRTVCRWLSSTTERIARATALRRRREAALQTADPTDALARLAATEPSQSASVERLEEQAIVRLALQELAPRCRDLLEALYYEDPPPGYADLARRLKTRVGSIGPTRARCFERLRAILAARAPDAFGTGITVDAAPTSQGSGTATGR